MSIGIEDLLVSPAELSRVASSDLKRSYSASNASSGFLASGADCSRLSLVNFISSLISDSNVIKLSLSGPSGDADIAN